MVIVELQPSMNVYSSFGTVDYSVNHYTFCKKILKDKLYSLKCGAVCSVHVSNLIWPNMGGKNKCACKVNYLIQVNSFNTIPSVY